jgi:hypothetical protein
MLRDSTFIARANWNVIGQHGLNLTCVFVGVVLINISQRKRENEWPEPSNPNRTLRERGLMKEC